MHQNFKSSPAFTFASKTAVTTSSNLSKVVPGPGQYSPNKEPFIPKIARQTFFAKSRRRQLFGVVDQTPGPANYYQKPSSSLRDSRISLGARLTQRKEKSPGPGQYNEFIKNMHNRYSFTRSTKHSPFESNSTTPPPCQYECRSSLSDRSIKIGSSNRKRLSTNEAEVPGPGTYKSSLDLSNVGLLMNKFSKSKRIRDKKIEKLPGPGSYQTKSMFENSRDRIPGPTISSKFRDIIFERKASLPGPSAQQITIRLSTSRANDKQQAAAYSIPKSIRQQLWKNKTRTSSATDFYDYNKTQDKTIKIQFPKDERLKPLMSETKKMGPGQYQNAVEEILKLKQTSPQFTISKSKRNTLPVPIDQKLNPGPGVHNPMLVDNTQTVTMAKTNRPSYTKQGPGPAAYSIKSQLKRSLDIKFARSRRTPMKLLGVPGPGAYQIKSRIPNVVEYK